MVDYNINNKEYLLSIKPSYKYIPIISVILLLSIMFVICFFKTYDIYSVKGYLTCEKECSVIVGVDISDINKITNAWIIKIDDKQVKFNNILIGDIQSDEVNKTNIQRVNIEIDDIDSKYLNTFQDIKIYSNYESIFEKIKKILF